MLFEADLSFWSGRATRYPLDIGYDTGIFVRINRLKLLYYILNLSFEISFYNF